MIEEIRVQSWNELLDRLYEGSWHPAHGRFRPPFVFRALAHRDRPLTTSLHRLGGSFGGLEYHVLRNFRKYAHRSAAPGDSAWNWLAVAKHHGLPTRLLDWTFSPFVALHFTTEHLEDFARDGVIWCVNCVEAQRFLPRSLAELLHKEGASVFTADMLDSYARTLSTFDERVRKEGAPCVIFFEPPSLDERIVNQMALFSMMSDPVSQLEPWLAAKQPECSKLCWKIVVPAPLKWEIRDKLDMANITERVIYPGLDGLSQWLKRYYSPSNIIELEYPEGACLAVIERFDGSLMHVGRYAQGSGPRPAVITTGADGVWRDAGSGETISVNPKPAPEKISRLLELLSKRGAAPE